MAKFDLITISYFNEDLVEKSLSLWDIIKSKNNSRYISYTSSAFVSDNISKFSYYYAPFERIERYKANIDLNKDWRNMSMLERWIYHVNSVICDNDQKLIDYIHPWIATPLQTPNIKNKTALVLKGKQGAGKSYFTEMIAHLNGPFGVENVGSMKSICGSFNKLLLNKTLIVANEVKNVDNNVYYDSERLKSYITDYQQDIEFKGEDILTKRIYANFVFVSNNDTPVLISDDDRRYVVITPSNKHGKDDYAYWSNEFYNLKDNQEFSKELYNYYINPDISKFNPRNIPMTEAKLDLIAQNRPRHEEFIIDYIEKFKHGFEKQDCFDTYLFWCRERNITNPGCEKTFRKNISEYVVFCQRKDSKSGNMVRRLPQKRFCGKVKEMYKLTDEKYEELKEYALENESIEIESDDEKPVLMRDNDN